MKLNSSVDRFVQMEYGQKNLESCTKPKSCVSLERVTRVVPANEPSMIKLSTREENDNELMGLWKMCMYLLLRSNVVYIGFNLSSRWRLSMVALMSYHNASGHLIGRRPYQRSCLYVHLCVTVHALNVPLWWFSHPMASLDYGNFMIHHLI